MKKRGNRNDYKSRYTILFAEQQKFIDRFKIYSFFALVFFLQLSYNFLLLATTLQCGLLGA